MGEAAPVYEADFIKLVQAALAKKRAGTPLKREEKRALERYQKDEDERARQRHFGQCPKKHYVAMSGRQHKVLDDQAATYGLPISGDTIDLAAVIRWLHDFLAENTHKLRKDDASEDDGSEAGEKLRHLRLKNELLAFELGETTRRLIDRHEVHDGAAAIAARLRTALDRLQRQCGDDAHAVMLEALDDAERWISERWGNTQHDDDAPG